MFGNIYILIISRTWWYKVHYICSHTNYIYQNIPKLHINFSHLEFGITDMTTWVLFDLHFGRFERVHSRGHFSPMFLLVVLSQLFPVLPQLDTQQWKGSFIQLKDCVYHTPPANSDILQTLWFIFFFTNSILLSIWFIFFYIYTLNAFPQYQFYVWLFIYSHFYLFIFILRFG